MAYRKIRELGRGGVATVWLAIDGEGREVALKQLDILRDDLRERLIHEGRVQRSVQHPNVVQVIDAIELDGRPTLILEHISGGTLAAWVPGRSCDQIEQVLRGILAGLGAAHEAGLVHRDLKPSNILMDGDSPKIADFGVARALDGDAGSTRTGMALGTPWYMSPEQIRDPRHVDRRADLWAVGALLYEMLAGRPPLVGDDVVSLHDQAVRRSWTPIRDLRPDVPANLVAAIEATLRPALHERVADVRALLLVLDGATPVDPSRETAGRWLLGKGIPAHAPVKSFEVTSGGVHGVAKSIRIGADRGALARFEREEQLIRELSHPRVPKILDAFVEDGRRWFVREAVPGAPLSAELVARRPSLAEILDRLDQILRTVADLHAMVPPVVHRDLTPDAIVIRPEGAWIIEFGTAKGDTDGRLADGTFVGTFGFMAPEQFGGEAGVASDVRAVGAIAAWMLTRRHPRALERNGALVWRPHTQVSPALGAWVDQLLDADPTRRPTAAAARAGLETLREDAAPRPTLVPKTVTPVPARARPVITAEPQEEVDLLFPHSPALRPKQPWLHGRRHVPARSAARLFVSIVVCVLTLGLGAGIGGTVLWTTRAAASPGNVIAIGAAPGGAPWPEAPDRVDVPSADILPPWDSVGLPDAYDDLGRADPDVLREQTPNTLRLDVAGSLSSAFSRYDATLRRAGWRPDGGVRYAENGRTQRYHRNGASLTFESTAPARGRAEIRLRLGVPEPVDRAPVYPSDRAPIPSPSRWDGVGLPDDGATIVLQTSSSILLDAPGAPREVGLAYQRALLAHGWTDALPLLVTPADEDLAHRAGQREELGSLTMRRGSDVLVIDLATADIGSTFVTLSLTDGR